MAENLAKAGKVWLAFCKFINSQTSKGKTVDTQLIGMFLPKDDHGPSATSCGSGPPS